MAIEIERKFLLCGEQWRDTVEQSSRLRQGYLSGERASIRVRLDSARAWLNIKSLDMGIQRQEFDYEIPYSDGEQLLGLAGNKIIDKTRHLLNVDGTLWEVDEFHGCNDGLVIAEVELSYIEEEFSRPDWLGREVTEDQRYYNSALSISPYTEWKEQK